MIVRSMAIVGVAAVVGLGHSMLRERPIRVAPPGATAPIDTTGGPGEIDPDPDGHDPVAGTDAPAYNADRVATLSGEALLDEAVLPGMITIREAHELFERGGLFLDARRLDEFEAGHIEGAVWMPADEVFGRVDELLMHDPALPVVIYCEGGTCEASHNVHNRLVNYGPDLGVAFERIEIMGLGYEEWKRAGLATSEGDSP